MILFTTLVLDVYIALLSFQVNGILPSGSIRILLLLFMAVESIVMLFLFIGPKNARKPVPSPEIMVCATIFIIYIVCYKAAV